MVSGGGARAAGDKGLEIGDRRGWVLPAEELDSRVETEPVLVLASFSAHGCMT